ncbi:recombinase family protein [Nonomuraea sp. 3N208]|uniref:recombinase family protein n=1 Tax=Nonomuraea sp. 3N208 TaxID=3457421 RepID=UPI003FCE13CF
MSDLPVATYDRVSVSRNGRSVSCEEQHKDNADCLNELNLKRGARYSDPGRKASPGAPERPQWNRLMDAVRAGLWGGVCVWDIDRATRDGVVGASMCDIVGQHRLTGFRVISASTNEVFDLSAQEGAAAFMTRVMDGEREVIKLRRRVARRMRRKAKAGETTGGPRRRFGFVDITTGTLHAAEAALIREAATRILAGERIGAVARDWAERGITTPEIRTNDGTRIVHKGGVNFTIQALKQQLRRPALTGHTRFSEGVLVGRMPGERTILDIPTWLELQSTLGSARRGRPATDDKYLLTSLKLVTCDSCDSRMSGHSPTDRAPRYRCCYNPNNVGAKGCGQSISAAGLEELVQEAALEWWIRAARRGHHARPMDLDQEIQHLRRRLEIVQQTYVQELERLAPDMHHLLTVLVNEITRLRTEIEQRTSANDLIKITEAAVIGNWNIGMDDHDPARRANRRRMISQAFRTIRIRRFNDGPDRRPTFDRSRVLIQLSDEG